MLVPIMHRDLLISILVAIVLFAPFPALAIGNNEYVMASQPDSSTLCPVDWQNCFTGGDGTAVINLGLGSTLGTGGLKNVTIAKDPSSPYVAKEWIIYIYCFTDISYSQPCTDWAQPNSWNGYQSNLLGEFTATSTDNKFWTADFTNYTHTANIDGTYPIVFNPSYYYQLVINDNGWNIGAYGNSSGVPYYEIVGTKKQIDPVVIIPGILGSWEKNGQWILDPLLHTYDNMVDTFIANGYIEGKTLFKFPYDWYQPNEVTAFELKNKIADIKAICGCSKVDLIGHSMGGLIAANYIERDDYAHDVDQLFLVATPLSGAPKAYKTWEAGEIDFGSRQTNIVMNLKFILDARKSGYDSIFSYIHNEPVVSIQELLPTYNYLQTNSNLLQYPKAYPVNAFLEVLKNNFSKIAARGVQTKVIAADTLSNTTIGGFTIASSTEPGLWEHGQPIATAFVAGDDTVPRISIENVTSIDQTIDDTDHISIASTSAPYLFKQMTGRDALVIIGKKYNALTSLLFFKLFSPIDMQITAPDGKKLGRDFATNSEVSQIPEAFYSGFGTDNEYAVIPNPLPGEYKVETIGTGSGGAYTIATAFANEATTSALFVTGTSTPQAIETRTFILSATSSSITLPPPPVATTTSLTPDSCVTDLTKAHEAKWIGKKLVYEKLVFDCKALKELFKARDIVKTKLAKSVVIASIKLVVADMELLAKDKGNTKDAVVLITKYTTWFKNLSF
jgi:pimeloyl-ACP methyl ester carboxylesterase